MDVPIDNTLLEALGIVIETCEPDCVVMRMPVSNATRQPAGFLHGGASVALAESAASVGTWLNVDQARQAAVGLEINANHIKSKRDGWVKATAIPLHKGRTTMVWDIRICDEADNLVCVSRCTVAIVDRR